MSHDNALTELLDYRHKIGLLNELRGLMESRAKAAHAAEQALVAKLKRHKVNELFHAGELYWLNHNGKLCHRPVLEAFRALPPVADDEPSDAEVAAMVDGMRREIWGDDGDGDLDITEATFHAAAADFGVS